MCLLRHISLKGGVIYVNAVVKATPEVNRFQLLPVTDEENPGLGGLDDKTNSGSSIKIKKNSQVGTVFPTKIIYL